MVVPLAVQWSVNWKNSFTSSGLVPGTFRLVAECLNHYAVVCPLSKSKSHYDRRSVGQFVLVSCPFWIKWPDVTFIWVAITFFIFHLRRPLVREDGSVICSAMTQVEFQVTLRPSLSVSSSWCLFCPFWSKWPDVAFIWVTITFFIFHVRRPLVREDGSVICSAMTQVEFQVTLRRTVFSASSSRFRAPNGTHNQILISLFDNYFVFSV
jgi:hypothetical protein